MGKEKKKIKISCTSKVTIIICIAAFILYIVSNHCKNSIITLIIKIAIPILCIAGMGLAIYLLISTIIDMLKTWHDEYRIKNNLFSGALSIFIVSIFIAIFTEFIGVHLDKGNYKIYHSIADAFIKAIPGWFTVMGVSYTAAIQKNRKDKDFINLNTPYPLIEFSSKKDLKSNQKKAVSIKVSNLADNILIPISVCGKELDYKPVTKSTFREFEDLEFSSFENNQETLFIFEDVNGIRYTTKLHINDALNEQPLEEYIIIENEKPILDEKEVTICKEGDLH